jgi:hypothetical protein
MAMATRARRDMTLEEFDAWADARRNVAEVNEACAEEGGPRVSLVPDPVSVPLDFLLDTVQLPVPAPSAGTVPFAPQPSRKTGGWSAMRQRLFIETLAETGSVHLSAKTAGLSGRSAYALRVRSPAFSNAWDAAQQLAVGRLSALAFDRAIHGRIEQVYHDGELVAEKRFPSDKLLMWLLSRLDPRRFAAPWERQKDDRSDPQAEAQQAFPALLGSLTDVAAD